MKLHYEWDETGGYDCITPAFVIRDERNQTVLVVDLKDFGWNEPGLGSGLSEHREHGRARALTITRMLCAAPEMLAALESLLNYEGISHPDEDDQRADYTKARLAITKAQGHA